MLNKPAGIWFKGIRNKSCACFSALSEAAANAYGVNVQAAALAVRYAFNGGEASIASSMRGEEKVCGPASDF
jgi:hypothetical protein